MKPQWPQGRRFAFTVVDDTDWATIENVKPVYDLLAELGMTTTKTAWMTQPESGGRNPGATCEDPACLRWLLGLQEKGFEIALHNAACGTSRRETTLRALDDFERHFGAPPALFCNHTGCRENIYWGDARLSGWRRAFYNLATRGRRRDISRGHVAGDPLFWGDLCRERVRYVRNFAFNDLDTLALCPQMPYHDPARPCVNFWFASADGSDLKRFLAGFTPQRFDRLEAAGGLCVAYTHFAAGFASGGRVDPVFRQRMENLAGRPGWFVPASQALDFLRAGATPADRTISPARLGRLETRWLFEKLFKGTT